MDNPTISCIYYINSPWDQGIVIQDMTSIHSSKKISTLLDPKMVREMEGLFHKKWANREIIRNSTICYDPLENKVWRENRGADNGRKKSEFEGKRDWGLEGERQCWVKRSVWDYKTKPDLTWPISDCSLLSTQTSKWRIMSHCFSKMTLAITSINTFCYAQIAFE